MVTETILKPIGNWQITIPQTWRKYLGIDKKHVRARLSWWKIIIEPLEKSKLERNIKTISLNKLNKETQELIAENEQSYIEWKTEEFISHEDFWKDV